MRAVCVLLLAGLLTGLAQGYSVDVPQVVVAQSKVIEDKDNYVGYSQENEIDSNEEDEGSFIASEETEEGKLWISDEDPDWTPSESQEDGQYDSSEDYSQEDDYTQEDYSQDDDYTQEDYSQDDDYTQEDYSQDDDYTQEDYSQEDDYSQEGDYTQEDDQEDTQPFPEVPVPRDDGVIAEYSHGDGRWQSFDDWIKSQENNQEDYFPHKGKREVQRRYQTGQQVVQVPAAYGSEQDRLDSGLWGAFNEGEGDRPGVSAGVEPLLPVGGPTQHEVAAGVEPELEGVTNDKDESGGSSIGGWFRQGWRRFTGAVEDLGDQAQDTFVSVSDKVEDKFSEAVDKIHQAYRGMRELVGRFKALISKFGILVQEGVRYCLRRFEHSFDQIQESRVIEKLEKELEKGHAEVAQFFQILGEKIKTWREQHTSADIDAGLIDGYTQEEQSQNREDIEQEIPDFFQDPQVLVHLNKLVDVGVLTQNDIIILTEEHPNQGQQNQSDQQYQQDQQQNQNDIIILTEDHPNQGQQNQQDQQYQQDQQNQQDQQYQQDQQQNQNYDFQQQNQQQDQQNYQQQSQFNPKFIQFPH